jgi:Phage protein (N4 Gp49/phage Sf6 gene 66) family
METEGLKATEAECAEGRTAPRVSLADIQANIATANYFTAGIACEALEQPAPERADVLTICILSTRSGYVLLGSSAPADTANFDYELGKKLAYEDAVRQLWPLMGYALRDRLSAN